MIAILGIIAAVAVISCFVLVALVMREIMHEINKKDGGER